MLLSFITAGNSKQRASVKTSLENYRVGHHLHKSSKSSAKHHKQKNKMTKSLEAAPTQQASIYALQNTSQAGLHPNFFERQDQQMSNVAQNNQNNNYSGNDSNDPQMLCDQLGLSSELNKSFNLGARKSTVVNGDQSQLLNNKRRRSVKTCNRYMTSQVNQGKNVPAKVITAKN